MTVDQIQTFIENIQAELETAPSTPRRTREADQEIVLNSLLQLESLLVRYRGMLQGRYRKGIQLTKLKGPAPI